MPAVCPTANWTKFTARLVRSRVLFRLHWKTSRFLRWSSISDRSHSAGRHGVYVIKTISPIRPIVRQITRIVREKFVFCYEILKLILETKSKSNLNPTRTRHPVHELLLISNILAFKLKIRTLQSMGLFDELAFQAFRGAVRAALIAIQFNM